MFVFLTIFVFPIDVSIQKVFECCLDLISFSLHHVFDEIYIEELTTPQSITFPAGLKEVDLKGCNYVGQYTILRVIETCRGLKLLNLSAIDGNEVLCDALLMRIAECCSGL